MQVITFVPDETPKGLACCACAFDAMIGVHSRAAAMKSLLRLSIFIKSSWFFFNYRIVGSIKGYVNRMLLRSASFENSIKMDFILISHFGFLVTLCAARGFSKLIKRSIVWRRPSLRETRENRSKDSQEQHVGSGEWPQLRLDARTQTRDNNRKLASRYKRHAGPYAAPPIDPGSSRRPVASHQFCKS
jgi:hypothetical protein